MFEQSLSLSAAAPRTTFFADVLRRQLQKICVVRDVHSSFTTASIIPDETADSFRNTLLLTTSPLRTSPSTIRIDTSTGFQSLRNDTVLQSYGIIQDYGYIKNKKFELCRRQTNSGIRGWVP